MPPVRVFSWCCRCYLSAAFAASLLAAAGILSHRVQLPVFAMVLRVPPNAAYNPARFTQFLGRWHNGHTTLAPPRRPECVRNEQHDNSLYHRPRIAHLAQSEPPSSSCCTNARRLLGGFSSGLGRACAPSVLAAPLPTNAHESRSRLNQPISLGGEPATHLSPFLV
jgi:hypothetical protein